MRKKLKRLTKETQELTSKEIHGKQTNGLRENNGLVIGYGSRINATASDRTQTYKREVKKTYWVPEHRCQSQRYIKLCQTQSK